jgi:hypothetical protein
MSVLMRIGIHFEGLDYETLNVPKKGFDERFRFEKSREGHRRCI